MLPSFMRPSKPLTLPLSTHPSKPLTLSLSTHPSMEYSCLSSRHPHTRIHAPINLMISHSSRTGSGIARRNESGQNKKNQFWLYHPPYFRATKESLVKTYKWVNEWLDYSSSLVSICTNLLSQTTIGCCLVPGSVPEHAWFSNNAHLVCFICSSVRDGKL